jgi:hypothetical protein
MFRVEVLSSEISASTDRTIETISLLYSALPSESFGEIGYTLLTGCIEALQGSAKHLPRVERDVYLLSHFLLLRESVRNLNGQIVGTTQIVDFEPLTEFLWRLLSFDRTLYQLSGERGLVKSLSGLSRVISNQIDGKKQLESETSLAFQSLTAYTTQLLAQPLLNLRARQAKEKPQVLAALEGVEAALQDHFQAELGTVVKKYVANDAQRAAVLDVLHGHLVHVIQECMQAFQPMDAETETAFASLKEKITGLSF